MNMRKIIAVLAAMLLLCTAIPMAAMSVSAASNLVGNGTFDVDASGWGKSTKTVLTTEDGALKATHGDDWAYVYTSVSLTPNTNYVITFRAKADKGGFKINFNDEKWNSAAATVPSLAPSITTEWKNYELYFNSAAYSKLLLFFQSDQYGTAAQTIWLDDVSVSAVDSSSWGTDDGYIRNGNFETGAGAPWVLGANASIVSDPTGSNKGYVVKSDEAGSGKSLFSQAALNLKANTDYKLSFKVYCYSTRTDNAFWVQFPKSVTNWSVDLSAASGMNSAQANDYTPRINVLGKTNAWYDMSITFNTGDLTAMLINFLNYRKDGGQYYFDDIKLVDPNASVEPEGGAIYAEDFESGELGGWTSNCSVATDMPVSNGSTSALKFVSTDYSYTNYKLTVEKNTTYRVQYSILSAAASRPLNARIRTGGSVDLAYNQHAGSTTAWQTFTMIFNSGNETSLNFRFQSAHTTCTYYIDNLSVTPVDVEQKDDGFIKNGDFETGMADNWDYTSSASYVKNPDGEGYVLQTNEAEKVNMLAQPINIVAGKEYVVYFKIYGYSTASNSAIYLRLGAPANTTWDTSAIKTSMAANAGDVSDSYTRQVRLNMNDKVGQWCYVAVPFTAAKSAAINVAIYNYRANEGKYYFDDFVVFEKKDASNDGYIVNGDFETGTADSWSTNSKSYAAPEAAKDGNFGIISKNPAGAENWGGTFNQSFAAEIGAQYKVAMDYKAISKGVNLKLVGATKDEGQTWLSASDWTHNEILFTATADTVKLNFCGGGTGAEEIVYLDNIVVTKVKDAHTHNYIGNETQAPTCTEDGVKTYACSCGEGTYTEAIPAKGHTPGAAATCENAQTCTVCGAELTAALGHDWADATCTAPKTCSVCGATEGEVSHNVLHVDAKAPTCTEIGNVAYWYCSDCGAAWLDAECTIVTNRMSVNLGATCATNAEHHEAVEAGCHYAGMAEYWYCANCDVFYADAACTTITNYLSLVIPALQDSAEYVPAKAATCTENGNVEYWVCYECEQVWADAALTQLTNIKNVQIAPSCKYGVEHHEAIEAGCHYTGMAAYWYCANCDVFYADADCTIVTNYKSLMIPALQASAEYVPAKAATCTENGNVEYWVCYECEQVWADAALTQLTNIKNVQIGYTGHTYDNDVDVNCNVCGKTRDVVAPVIDCQNSVSEDVSGLAFKFDVEVEGLDIVEGRLTMIDYTNATYHGYKLIEMGAVAENGKGAVTIPATHLFALDEEKGEISVAYRIINIPLEEKPESATTPITMTPYFVVEIDGENVTIYGEPQTATYNGVLNG